MLEEVNVVLVEELRHDLIVRILLRVFFILVNERVLKKRSEKECNSDLAFRKNVRTCILPKERLI